MFKITGEKPIDTVRYNAAKNKLIKQREILTQQLEFYDQIIKKFNSNYFPEQRRRFWSWLYTHNRDAWYVLDPIVSVQPDATFFEAFSLDESTYARVALPHTATTGEKNFTCGTTNIDFSASLERELSRTRSYRPLHLTVGKDAVEFDTGISNTIEKKIDLPETWTKGLVEGQAALSLAPVEINISSPSLTGNADETFPFLVELIMPIIPFPPLLVDLKS